MLTKITALALTISAILAENRPNILFIFTDDWGWGDLSCHGHPHIKTPNIDRLAAEGTDFQRFTVASGVCSPSRAAVMTGHFPARYNIDGHFAFPKNNAKRGMPDWLDLDAPYLAEILQTAGYRTAHYGKWHLSNNMIPDSPKPGEYGYDEYGAFNCSGTQMPWFEDAERASAFMTKSVQEKKPFFINVWMHEPHTPHHTIPVYEEAYADLDRPEQIYASVLSHADDRVGQMLDTLDSLGIADNTLVVFSSDNGPAGGVGNSTPQLFYDSATGAGWNTGASKGTTGGRRGRKKSLFEGGIGVPFLVRWPDAVAAGAVDDQSLISAVDLLPTFCGLAGATLPETYNPDGLDVSHVFKGETMPSRTKPLFWKMQNKGNPNKGASTGWAAWVTVQGEWKLIADITLEHIELYHISKDVGESTNVAAEQPETTATLLASLKEWKESLPKSPSGDVFSTGR